MRETEEEIEDTYGKDLPWRKVSGFVLRIVLRHPFLLAGVILASLGVVAAELLSFALILPFLDTLGGGGASAIAGDFKLAFLLPYFEGMSVEDKVRIIALGLLGVTFVRGLFSYVESRISSYMKIILERDLRQMVFDELLRVELQFIHKEKVANLFTILHSYPKSAAALADEYLASLSKVITLASFVLVLIDLSWQLTAISLLLGAISVGVVARFRVFIKRMGRRINRSRVRLHQASLESLNAMKAIRLFAREDYARGRFLDQVRALQRDSFKQASLSAAVPPVQRTINMALFAGLLVVATFMLVGYGEGWLVLLTAFIVIVSRLMGPLGSFAKRQTRIATQMPALEAIIDFMERPDKAYLAEGERRFERMQEGVRFDGVSFAYNPGAPVLQDVSFDVRKGSKVALVGSSGSGKSTTINLLARLSDPTAGRVLVDGVDLREFQIRTWRRRVAVVSQDTFLFNTTIRENIRFGRLEATDAEVEEAAKLANAHEFILQMEHGYETTAGDRGVRLSGGQAQRIAIARALLADPDILVLDEATSALDTATERLVQEALERASRDRTVVAVAHRLSTIRNADLILVLEQGRIVERGTHDELLALQGHYASYVRMQDVGENGAEATRPEPPAATIPAGMMERAPMAPLSIVLAPGHKRASLRRGDLVVRESVPVSLTLAGRTPWDVLRELEGDGVVLWPGADAVKVRIDGQVHDEVPLYAQGIDGQPPHRVRVQRIKERRKAMTA